MDAARHLSCDSGAAIIRFSWSQLMAMDTLPNLLEDELKDIYSR